MSADQFEVQERVDQLRQLYLRDEISFGCLEREVGVLWRGVEMGRPAPSLPVKPKTWARA